MFVYRTKTYIAGDWDGDSDAIEKLYEWKEDAGLLFHFVDVHSFMRSYDSSHPCSIKSSLRTRLLGSKCFVLIVGNHTNSTTKGSCQFCENYDSSEWLKLYGLNQCKTNGQIDYRSFIKYECEMAARDFVFGELSKIVVLYNSVYVDKSKCPDCIRELAGVKHIPMKCYDMNGHKKWDYQNIKNAIM